jgi:hypothetical protein
MKKYSNMSQEMRFVQFDDGDAQFLFRGQSFTSEKTAVVVQKGIRVTDVPKQVSSYGAAKPVAKPKVPTTPIDVSTKE